MRRTILVIAWVLATICATNASDDIRCVQEQLNLRGYNAGAADGQLGGRTTRASSAIASDYRLELAPLNLETAAPWCVQLTAMEILPGVALGAGGDNFELPRTIAKGLVPMVRPHELTGRPWMTRIVDDVLRTGSKSLRMEIRTGDCYEGDCVNGSERIEVFDNDNIYKEGWTTKHTWSLFFPKGFPTCCGQSDTVLGQLHQDTGHPAFQLYWEGRGLWMKARTKPELANSGSYGHALQLVLPESELRGRWHDFEVITHWSRGDDGTLAMKIDGAVVYDYEGPTLSPDARAASFRTGIYRDASWGENNMVIWLADYVAKRL